jgi:hypothetical protein
MFSGKMTIGDVILSQRTGRDRNVSVPNFRPMGAEYCVTSCDLGVFVEEAAEPVSSNHLDVGVDGIE